MVATQYTGAGSFEGERNNSRIRDSLVVKIR
jgi:hypothetical protein